MGRSEGRVLGYYISNLGNWVNSGGNTEIRDYKSFRRKMMIRFGLVGFEQRYT